MATSWHGQLTRLQYMKRVHILRQFVIKPYLEPQCQCVETEKNEDRQLEKLRVKRMWIKRRDHRIFAILAFCEWFYIGHLRHESDNEPDGVGTGGVAVPGTVADGLGGGTEAVTPVETIAVPADSKEFRANSLRKFHIKPQLYCMQDEKQRPLNPEIVSKENAC